MPSVESSPPEPDGQRSWHPPLWDRPSEGTLATVLPVNEIVLRTTDAVVVVDHLRVYPNGFTVILSVLANPHVRLDGNARMAMLGGPGADSSSGFPRLGARFADGRVAEPDDMLPLDVPKDASGIPTGPVSRLTGLNGSSSGYQLSYWVYPLPPDGEMEIFVSIRNVAGSEAKVVVDGRSVRAAAERSTVVWC